MRRGGAPTRASGTPCSGPRAQRAWCPSTHGQCADNLPRRPTLHRRGERLSTAAASSSAAYRGPESFPSGPTSDAHDASSPAGQSDEQRAAVAAAEVLKLVSLLPPAIRSVLESHPRLPELIEVVMDLGRPPLARFPGGDVRLVDSPISHDDLAVALALCGAFGGDNRAGIDATLHRISAIRNRAGRVVGLTCRVGRAIRGSAAMVADLATEGKSILLLGRPGVGKTTAIREISRLLANDHQRRVVIVDTSNEIGGDGDVPHPGVGRARRMQVPQPEQQHKVMIEAVENHMPEVVVIDEIGTEAEALAARTIAQRGVQLIATAHGNELENVMKNPSLNDLVGGISSVTLGDEEAKRRGVQKSVLERSAPPTFDAAVEMVSRDQWRIHLDVGAAVDLVLQGREAGAEVRERDAEGRVFAWPEDAATDVDESDAEEEAGAARAAVRPAGRQRAAVETQPFPEAALLTARHGVAAAAAAAAAAAKDVAAAQAAAQVAALAAAALRGGNGRGKGSSRGGKRAVAAPAQPLQVYLYGVDPDSVRSVSEALGMERSLVITDAVQTADAVLATRPKLKASGWIRGAATAARVPIYSVRSASVEHVVKAVRTLLGVDPSPGGLFAAGGSEAPAGADPKVSSGRTLRAETSIALVNSRAAGSSSFAAGSERDALEEARLAVESIVMRQGQPAELLPRDARVVELQCQLAAQYGLEFELVGSAAEGGVRLRVMPPGWQPPPGPEEAAAARGDLKKQFW